ncbi:MAG: hypothetical protein NTY19_42755 [Planctomycetota bacterium]|nr:hypothetical protein [Planctomycetota bacterium]
MSPRFADQFAKRFGARDADFAKYLIYFAYGQEDCAIDLSATQGIMHVFGPSPQEIRQTALFRAHYYRFLQDGLTDLLVQAKRHAEQRMGHRLEARGHATWAKSPTCDHWASFAGVNPNRQRYEYTSDYVWSNTIQQHAVAPQTILTHELVDRIYPIAVLGETQPVASVQNQLVGTQRVFPRGGNAEAPKATPLEPADLTRRYGTPDNYRRKMAEVVDRLIQDRFLPESARAKYVADAAQVNW